MKYVTLREIPDRKDEAALWFHEKWGVPQEAYQRCMDDYLEEKTELGWYLCLDGERIVAGLGVIENDFHVRKDLKPNICAVYTEADHRGLGITGKLLDMAVCDLVSKGITPVYLVSDHIGFYERYGWQFLEMVEEEDGGQSRIYVHY